MKKETLLLTKAAVSSVSAYVINHLGLLWQVLILLTVMMVLDYGAGLAASMKEALEDPDNPDKGWSSKKGKIGIFKKLGYIIAVSVAMAADFLIFRMAEQIGMMIPTGTFFGILTAVWFVLNELLSLIENAGRMGAPIPDFLRHVIATLKSSVERKGDSQNKK